MTLSRADLERLGVIRLAVLCGKVADQPSKYPKDATEQASQLKRQWALLQTPPEPSFKKEQEKQAKLIALRQQMLDFLSSLGVDEL